MPTLPPLLMSAVTVNRSSSAGMVVPSHLKWSPASGGSALFSGAPITLLNKMASSEKLVISYKPYSKTAVSAVFEFDQSRSDLIRMQEVCK